MNRSVTNLVLDATYLNRVNRVFGQDSPQGDYEGDSFLLNAGYQTKIGKITRLRLSTRLRDHRRRAGRREPDSRFHVDLWPAFRGREAGGQDQAGLRRLVRHADRLRATIRSTSISTTSSRELTATFRQFGLGVGTEIMEGNGCR